MSFSSRQLKLPVIYGCTIKLVSVDHRLGSHCINKLLFATNFMYWKTKWFSTSLGCTILLIKQSAINLLASRKNCYPVENTFIMEAHPWLYSVGFSRCFFFFHCKILLETSILRVKTPNGPGEQFLRASGIEVGRGGWKSKFDCSLFVAV